MQQIQIHYKRFRNFLGFARSFLIRKNPIQTFVNDCVSVLKDILSVRQKQKMARYRLNYQMHKLNQLETLISENNEHAFLKGTKFNEMR